MIRSWETKDMDIQWKQVWMEDEYLTADGDGLIEGSDSTVTSSPLDLDEAALSPPLSPGGILDIFSTTASLMLSMKTVSLSKAGRPPVLFSMNSLGVRSMSSVTFINQDSSPASYLLLCSTIFW